MTQAAPVASPRAGLTDRISYYRSALYPTETTAFFNQLLGLDLSFTDAAALEDHTGSWIAGLQVAALSMQGRDDLSSFIAAITGNRRFILD